MLTSSLPIARAARSLPEAGFPVDVLSEGGTFRGLSLQGAPMTYAVTPVLSGQIVMVGLASDPVAAKTLFYLERAAYFPMLMWLASLVVGFFVVEFLVSRHVKIIVGAMRRFGETRQSQMPLTLAAAPAELRAIGDAFETMTQQVVSDAAMLEEGLQQKNVLLREVHHRTKNNLQMISSIMSVHKGMYQTSGVTHVQLDELVADIVHQLQALTPGARATQIDLSCPPVLLQHDEAVPFSLLVTEALTNAIKYATATGDGRRYVTIVLNVLNETSAELVIENTFDLADSSIQTVDSTGFGSQLMGAFATQLNAKINITKEEGIYRFVLRFALFAPTPEDHVPTPE